MREFINQFLGLARQIIVLLIDLYNYIKSFFNKRKITSIKDDLNREVSEITKKTKNFYETNLNLGLYHFYKGNINDASFRFKTLKLLYKENPVVYYNLARCSLLSGNLKKAAELFEQTKKVGGLEYKEVKFFLDYINGVKLDSIPGFVIKERFDYLAHNYVENFLVGRCYIGHKLILDETLKFFTKKPSNIKILDLGCGTGICTHFLKLSQIGSEAIGVDISDNMLAIAGKCLVNSQPIFDQLHNQDIIDFLNEHDTKKYDLIIAADSFGYLGDLQDVISKCKNILADNGVIIILVTENKGEGDYVFDLKKISFSYSDAYLKKLAANNDLHLSLRKCKYENMLQGLIGCYTKQKINHKHESN